MLASATWSEWLPSSSTAPASARDSSRRYFFTLVLPFPRHFSLKLYVGVLVKHRLLGMTGGGEVAAGGRSIPSSSTPYPTARERKGTNCHSERAAVVCRDRRIPFSYTAYHCYKLVPGFYLSPYGYIDGSGTE